MQGSAARPARIAGRLEEASLLSFYRLAALGTRSEVEAALRGMPPAALGARMLRGALLQHTGDVDGAMGALTRAARDASGVDRAPVLDLLAPISIMRHANDALEHSADVLDECGWAASAEVLRAIAAADAGRTDVARRRAARARAALVDEDDDVVRARVLQRLARVAYLLNEYQQALDDASASGAIFRRLNGWRGAAACYTIAYNIHHAVTGNLPDADRYASLWRAAASRAEDSSFEYSALVAEYEMAVQMGDSDRVRGLEELIRARGVPQQYVERFPYAISCAIARGAHSVREMRTILNVLRSVPDLSDARQAVCAALVAVSCAAEAEDESVREHVRRVQTLLGRPRKSDPAYERRYRRLARAAASAACALIGDDVRATRLVASAECKVGDGEDALPSLMRADALSAAPRAVRGLALVLDAASRARRRSEPPADLTRAQFEVLQLLSRGWSAERIATETGRSRNTVYNHSRAILERLGAQRAPEAVAIARERGLLA